MTERGFYWSYPIKRRKPPELRFFDWIYIRNVAVGILIVGMTDQLRLIRSESFETKANFKERKKEFALKVLPLIINRCNNWRQENDDDPQRMRSKINVKYV